VHEVAVPVAVEVGERPGPPPAAPSDAQRGRAVDEAAVAMDEQLDASARLL
jgi:hypothetical protein